jgi:hypothetical protein
VLVTPPHATTAMARCEYLDWCTKEAMPRCRCDPSRDDRQRARNKLLRWEDFDAKTRKVNIDSARAISELLQQTGYSPSLAYEAVCPLRCRGCPGLATLGPRLS